MSPAVLQQALAAASNGEDLRAMTFKHTRENGVETVWVEGAKGPMMIYGLATTPRTTHHKGWRQSLSSDGCSIKLPVPLRWRHSNVGSQIGEVVWVQKSKSGIYVRATLDPDEAGERAFELVRSGEIRCLSISMYDTDYVMKECDGLRYFTRWRLKEVSLCPKGLNPEAFCRVYDGLRR
jgi:hypothetical protein